MPICNKHCSIYFLCILFTLWTLLSLSVERKWYLVHKVVGKIFGRLFNTTRRVRGPPHHAQVWWFTGRTHRTRQIVAFTAMIYYSKRIESKVSKEKRHMGPTWEETRLSFQPSCPTGVTQVVLNFSSNELWYLVWHAVYQGSSSETQCPGLLLGAGLHRHPVSGMCQNSRLQEGKQVFNINHVVCTVYVQWVSYSYQLGC